MKHEFYNHLYQSDDFCTALGRVMLSASKLEILLKQYLRLHGNEIPEKKATLGNLISHLKKNNLLTKNGELHFGQANIQRNYLIHNLYGSFVNEIERAFETAESFELYSKIVSKTISKTDLNDELKRPLL